MKTNQNYITLSIAHLSPITRRFLELYTNNKLQEYEVQRWMDELGIYEKKNPRNGECYGYFVYSTFEPNLEMKLYYPADIFACICYAANQGADFIVFDSDAPTIDDLPRYDDTAYSEAVKVALSLAKQQLHKILNAHDDDDVPLCDILREYDGWLSEMIAHPDA